MINNDVLDMTHFTDANAGEAEREVASAFAVRKEEVKNSLTKIFSDSNAAAYKDQPKEIQAERARQSWLSDSVTERKRALQ